MKKIILAVFLSAFMLCGCSHKLKPAKSFETIEFSDLKFDLRDGFEESEDGAYIYDLNYEAEFSFSKFFQRTMEPEVIVSYLNIIYDDEEQVTSDILEWNDYEVAYNVFEVENDEEGELKTPQYSRFSFSCCGSAYFFSVYHDSSDRKAVKELAEEIFESLEYTGEYTAPEAVEKIENEFISVDVDENWSLFGEIGKDSSIRFSYENIDSLAKIISSVRIEDYTAGEYDTIKEYGDAYYKKSRTNEKDIVKKPEKTSIFGCNAVKLERSRDLGTDILKYDETVYFFEKGGVIHKLTIKINNQDGCDEVKKDIEKLLKSITVKEISKERQEEIEAAKITDYETEHFKFSLSSYYELNKESHFDGLDFYNIQVTECESDPDKKPKELAEDIADEMYGYYIYDEDVELGCGAKRIDKNVYAIAAKLTDDGDEVCFVYDNGVNALKVVADVDIEEADDVFDNKKLMEMLGSVEAK